MPTTDLDINLEEIPNLPMSRLKALYTYLFSLSTKSSRREFYIWRITNRLQELRFGGLDAKTRTLLENMEDIPTEDKPLPVGTEIVKKYKGETYKLRVVRDGFEMNDTVFKSLSGVAYHITGRKISGQDFFGV